MRIGRANDGYARRRVLSASSVNGAIAIAFREETEGRKRDRGSGIDRKFVRIVRRRRDDLTVTVSSLWRIVSKLNEHRSCFRLNKTRKVTYLCDSRENNVLGVFSFESSSRGTI